MVGHSRACHLHHSGDVDDALLAVTQQPEDPHARGVAHLLEDICDDLKIVRLCELRPDLLRILSLAVVMGELQVRHHISLLENCPFWKCFLPVWKKGSVRH